MKRLLPLGFLLASLLFAPRLAGAQSNEVTAYAPDGAVRLIAVSPDGAKIAGSPDLGGDTLCVYAIPSGDELACADLHARQIDLNIEDVSWSPDSATVVFGERPFVTFKDGDIWAMNAATGELTNLTDDGYEGELPFIQEQGNTVPVDADILPRVSPDGASVAFSRTRIDDPAANKPSELWLLDLATGESRSVARFSETEPGLLYFNLAWSPDGGTVYVSVFHADLSNPENGVWAVDVETGRREQIAGATAEFKGAAPAVMSVSPRGDALTVYYPALLGQYGTMESGFGLLTLATGEIDPIVAPESVGSEEVPAAVLAPGFTPDGSALMYIAHGFTGVEGALVLRDLAFGDQQIIELPGNAEPTVSGYRDSLILGADGTVLILTDLNTADLVPLDNPALLERPETTSAPGATPASTPVANSTATLEILGSYVQLYAAPTTDAPVVFVFTAGDEVEQIGAPVEAAGETWIPVRDPASGTIGYVQQEQLAP
jgi:hypothetical protein